MLQEKKTALEGLNDRRVLVEDDGTRPTRLLIATAKNYPVRSVVLEATTSTVLGCGNWPS